MTADKNPIEDAVEQALDAFVYAPIGLLFDGPGRFPKLVRNGRNQVNNARMIGPFALQQARAEVQRLTADLDGPVVDLLRGLGVVPDTPPGPAPQARDAAPAAAPPAEEAPARAAEMPAPADAEKAPAKKAAAKKVPTKKAAKAASDTSTGLDTEANRAAAEEAAAARTAATDTATPSADVLPIPDYDSLSASQVVSRLQGLTAGQLDAIRAYESGTRGRKTILNRVQQLSKP